MGRKEGRRRETKVKCLYVDMNEVLKVWIEYVVDSDDVYVHGS